MDQIFVEVIWKYNRVVVYGWEVELALILSVVMKKIENWLWIV